MGGRLLRRWIGNPLCNRARLAERHAAIGALLAGYAYESLREELRGVGEGRITEDDFVGPARSFERLNHPLFGRYRVHGRRHYWSCLRLLFVI